MNHLASYIRCIHNQPSHLAISHQTSQQDCYLDGGIEITEQQSLYHFENGVVIRHNVEQDNALSDQACQECWISYEVVEQGEQRVRPASKTFYNVCQQSFWLKMQARAEI